jgi:hypothetical protein
MLAQMGAANRSVTRALPSFESALVTAEPPKGIEPLTYALRGQWSGVQVVSLSSSVLVSGTPATPGDGLNGGGLDT